MLNGSECVMADVTDISTVSAVSAELQLLSVSVSSMTIIITVPGTAVTHCRVCGVQSGLIPDQRNQRTGLQRRRQPLLLELRR